MIIVFIHGHGASSDSFSFIRLGLSAYPHVFLEYDSDKGFENNYRAMQAQLEGVEEIFFIAHSLGGIYAVHLANALGDRVRGAVTISTPYGGSQAAQLVKYMLPFNQMLRDIQPGSPAIEQANGFDIVHPWTNVVTTGGHSSLMMTANDGIVTRDSMAHRGDISLVEIDSGHFEVLLNPATVRLIQSSLQEAQLRAALELQTVQSC